MHNIVSQNNLAEWNHHTSEHDKVLDDYYECLIECETDQSSCKSICKEILM